MSDGPKIIVIGGPTAAGKSAAAVELCHAIGGEIVSADSVQVFRGLDIGSAKPTAAERGGVPHHLIDICDPTERYSAARFVADADALIAAIAQRGAVPVVVGGTGLYLRSLLRGLFSAPRAPTIRARLEAEAQHHGASTLHRRLSEVDPVAATRINENDAVRVVRALEVFEVTGSTITEFHEKHGLRERRHPHIAFTWTRDRATLDERIRLRLATMMEMGWVQEVEELIRLGVPPDAQALRAVGYAAIVRWLTVEPRPSEESLIETIFRSTRTLSKRQLTFFRGQIESRWLDAGDAMCRDSLLQESRTFLDEG